MQSQSTRSDPRSRFTGSYDALKKIYQLHGSRGVYKGFFPTLGRDIIGFSMFFGTYEILKQMGTNDQSSKPNLARMMFNGSIAGILLWTASYPFDIIKTKVQTDSFIKPTYTSTRDCFAKTWRQEGIRGFTKGFLPCAFRSIFTLSATVVAYETSLRALQKSLT